MFGNKLQKKDEGFFFLNLPEKNIQLRKGGKRSNGRILKHQNEEGEV